MSVKISGQVWELDLEPVDKLVLLALADHADHEGQNIRPGNELLCAKTGLSRPTITAKIAGFIRDGILQLTNDEIGRGNKREFSIELEGLPRHLYFAERDLRKGKPAFPNNAKQKGKPAFLNGETKEASGFPFSDSEKGKADSEKGKADRFAYKEHEPSEPSIEPSIKPSEKNAARVPSIIGLLADAYKNIATTQKDETVLMQQCAEIEGVGATLEEVQAWLDYRHTLPSPNYIATEFKKWRVNRQRQIERGITSGQQPRFETAAERSTRRLAERDYDAIALAAAGYAGALPAD